MGVFISTDDDKDNDNEQILIPAPRISHVLNLSVDEQKRTIFLDGEIAEEAGSWAWAVMQYLGKDPITIDLNTPGGDVDSMYAIHDAIRLHGNVTVRSYGQCCSAGVLILACGHKRLVTESLILMSHESSTDSGELGYKASKDRRKAEDWQHSWWCELMARYTGKDAAWWKRTTDKQAEYWLLGGHSIVEAGLADEVIY